MAGLASVTDACATAVAAVAATIAPGVSLAGPSVGAVAVVGVRLLAYYHITKLSLGAGVGERTLGASYATVSGCATVSSCTAVAGHAAITGCVAVGSILGVGACAAVIDCVICVVVCCTHGGGAVC